MGRELDEFVLAVAIIYPTYSQLPQSSMARISFPRMLSPAEIAALPPWRIRKRMAHCARCVGFDDATLIDQARDD